MAPILEEMEQHLQEEVGRVTVQFQSYMNDLHCGLYDRQGAKDDTGKRERMQHLVVRAQRVVAEAAAEFQLPLAANKDQSIHIRNGCGRKKRSGGIVKKVKWLGVILEDFLNLKEHW